VFDRLLDAGATIIVIDHDLDLLAGADHLIDMGPGGGPDGGHIVAAGTPDLHGYSLHQILNARGISQQLADKAQNGCLRVGPVVVARGRRR
jgi:energy-coupling factor transporter ATP-binding protein EcfA2